MSLELKVDRYCFVCGPENPEGLRAVFETGGGRATGRCSLRDEHQGYAGVTHGGIVAALLDEAMVYAACSLGCWAATAEMTVRYSRPVPTGGDLEVVAEVVTQRRKIIECRAELRDAEGAVLAGATAKMIQGRPITEEERRTYCL